MKKRLKSTYELNDKKTIFVYGLLYLLTIICLIREVMNGNLQNAVLCVVSLFLFIIPQLIEKKFKVDFPGPIERIICIFIFSAEILGEINNFYIAIPFWDTALHTLNGFLCASIGFSLVNILNKKTELVKLSPIFVSLVAFCFSMTVGITWEIYEYGVDTLFKFDMQKDEYVETIKTVALDPKDNNDVIVIDDIDHTIIYDKFNNKLAEIDNYLDIGLHDTMEDLIVNFLGALVFCFFGYLYLINEKKYNWASNFITKKTK